MTPVVDAICRRIATEMKENVFFFWNAKRWQSQGPDQRKRGGLDVLEEEADSAADDAAPVDVTQLLDAPGDSLANPLVPVDSHHASFHGLSSALSDRVQVAALDQGAQSFIECGYEGLVVERALVLVSESELSQAKQAETFYLREKRG